MLPINIQQPISDFLRLDNSNHLCTKTLILLLLLGIRGTCMWSTCSVKLTTHLLWWPVHQQDSAAKTWTAAENHHSVICLWSRFM